MLGYREEPITMSKKRKKQDKYTAAGEPSIAYRRARSGYHLQEKLEAGGKLPGTEVKGLRNGQV